MPTTATQACDIIINAGETIVTQANKTTCLHGGTYVQIVNISADKAKLTSYPGEHAIIDGQNSLAANYGALVRITGGYVEVSDIEVQRSGITGTGIRLTGTHGLISNVNVHHCMGSGIHVDGDYGIVENSEVWSNEMNNENGGSTIDWGFGLSAARYPTGVIMRNNYVHDNWGEGLSTFEATGTLIEGNIIADNWSVNLYISDARDVIARGNTIYTTTTSPVQNGNRVGILLGDERCGSTPSVCSERITVTNNTVRNAGYINLYWWYPSIIDNIITGNTFENAQSQAGVEIHTDTGVVQNTVFENNIIIQTNRLPAIINQTNIDTSKNTVITSQVSTPTPTLTIIPLAATDTPEPMVTNTPMPTLTPTETLISSPQPDLSPLPGLSWEAEQGDITPPFTVENGIVSQNTSSDDPSVNGRALYRFTIQDAGEYVVRAIVNAANSGKNSFFVGMDAEPDTNMIWDIVLTNGFEERTVSWREGAAPDANASTPKVFYLAPGEHSLIIRGREANTLLDKVEVAKALNVQPTTTPVPTQTPVIAETPTVVIAETSTPTAILYTDTPLPTETPLPTFTAAPLDTTPPTITDITNNGYIQWLVTFSEDIGWTGADPANFSLNGASGGPVVIDSISYDSNSYTTTLNLNGGNPLPPDDYTLLVAGTKSITDLAGNKLDGNSDGIGGDDFVQGFSIQAPTSTPTETPVPASPTPTETATATPVPPTATATETATPVPPTATATASEVVYDDKDSAFAYSADWEDVYNRQAYHGSAKETTKDGSFVTLNFTGQTFSVLYTSGKEYREMEVYVDNVLVGTINERNWGWRQTFQKRWDYPGQLTPGAHTLKLVFDTSDKRDRTRGSLDAVIVR